MKYVGTLLTAMSVWAYTTQRVRPVNTSKTGINSAAQKWTTHGFLSVRLRLSSRSKTKHYQAKVCMEPHVHKVKVVDYAFDADDMEYNVYECIICHERFDDIIFPDKNFVEVEE
jgi:hypothetical protein